jgi:hypothetical protein
MPHQIFTNLIPIAHAPVLAEMDAIDKHGWSKQVVNRSGDERMCFRNSLIDN